LEKYLTGKDILKFWGISKKIPEQELKLCKKYLGNFFMCIFGGFILMLFLYILQWNFHLFEK